MEKINEIIFKKYDNYYYVSRDGEVYSKYCNRCLKHYIDKDGYHRVDIHGKHIKIHKLVYLTWVGNIPIGKQVNHIDDNKSNNDYTNLYCGCQKQNIKDCIRNNHRAGNVYKLTILEKKSGKILNFQPAKDFFKYEPRKNINGSIKKVLNRKWFKEKYEVISIEKGVTTIEH